MSTLAAILAALASGVAVVLLLSRIDRAAGLGACPWAKEKKHEQDR